MVWVRGAPTGRFARVHLDSWWTLSMRGSRSDLKSFVIVRAAEPAVIAELRGKRYRIPGESACQPEDSSSTPRPLLPQTAPAVCFFCCGLVQIFFGAALAQMDLFVAVLTEYFGNVQSGLFGTSLTLLHRPTPCHHFPKVAISAFYQRSPLMSVVRFHAGLAQFARPGVSSPIPRTMQGYARKCAVMDQMPTDGFRDRPVWLIGVTALVFAQVGLGLALFSANRSWASVLDDRPILDGRHPLHLYHGVLGAASFHERGVATCYDPNFQAGYPKTPVFDGGSRPAELFLFLGGGKYRPGAYKLGLFAFLLLIPVAFVSAARGCGLPTSAAVLSGVVGIVLGWSPTVREMIVEGQLDLLGAGLAGLTRVCAVAGSLCPNPRCGRVARAGWNGDDRLVFPAAHLGRARSTVIFAHYLVFAPRHGPAWHLGLAGITFVGVAPNAWWLSDWGKYWWLRKPFPGDHIPFPTWQSVLGQPSDYPPLFEHLPGGMVLVFGGIVGIVLLWRTGHKSAAWLLLLSALFAVMMARVAGAWSANPTSRSTAAS